MTFIRKLLSCGMGLALGMGLGTVASASVYTEIGDAPSGPSWQLVNAGATRIDGTLAPGDDGDLFRIRFATGGMLTIDATSSWGDTDLFLFDSNGYGVRADEQSGGGSGYDARITVTIAAGDYLIGIGDYLLLAVDRDGTLWYADDPVPPDDFGRLYFLHSLGGPHVAEETYSIHLVLGAGDDIPEPAALGLLGAALIGLGAAGRRRARAKTTAGVGTRSHATLWPTRP